MKLKKPVKYNVGIKKSLSSKMIMFFVNSPWTSIKRYFTHYGDTLGNILVHFLKKMFSFFVASPKFIHLLPTFFY